MTITQGVREAMSAQLESLGFTTMSQDVLNETDNATISKYARFIVNRTPKPMQDKNARLYMMLGLI